ncbi:MAG: phosphotransferase [Candidatus Limnocylindrales bacterium]
MGPETSSEPLIAGELRDRLVAALQRLPELAGRELVLTPISGGITNRNFRVNAADAHGGLNEACVVRLGGNDTHLLGISREVEHAATVAAAGVGVGPEVIAFIRPEGYLVTRFIEGTGIDDAAVHEPPTIRRVADSIRRIHGGPAIPGIFTPFRIGEAYRALALARGVSAPDAYDTAHERMRRIEIACLRDPVEMRPCHNDLLNANFIDDGERIRIVDWEYAGMGDPFFDLGNFSVNHGLDADEDALLLEAYEGEVRPERLARLRLMRVVSDFREGMWGVLQQAISTLEVDFAAYATRHLGRLIENASSDAFEVDLRRLEST